MLIYKASKVNNIINASLSYSHFKANTSFFTELTQKNTRDFIENIESVKRLLKHLLSLSTQIMR